MSRVVSRLVLWRRTVDSAGSDGHFDDPGVSDVEYSQQGSMVEGSQGVVVVALLGP